jgi:hypothetical protein
MPLITEKFDQHKVDIIKRYLQRETDKGRPKDFEIIVDGFKVVSRTSDIEEFDDYEQEVTEDSHNLTILVYGNANANRNTRYSFSLQNETVRQSNQPANGLGEIDQVIAQKLEEKEREHEFSKLKEQLSATKTQLAEAEEYADNLQKRIKDMEEKRYTQAVSLGEVASVVLKTLVKQHAARIPGGQALAGLLGADLPEELPVSAPQEAAPVSFERQPDSEPLDEQTRNRLSLIEQMQHRFTEQQLIAVFSIMDALSAAPEKIEAVLVQLGLQAASAAAA